MAARNKGETDEQRRARMKAMSDKALLVTVRHGHSGKNWHSPTYRSWHSMVNRCELPRSRAYPHYGARGIRVCERWRDFANFLADMGVRPVGTSLDRINNDGHYEPGNCRWATPVEQARNTSKNRCVEFRGRRACIEEWAQTVGICGNALRYRIRKWGLERALTTPPPRPAPDSMEVDRGE
jgi:hypothetical protein